MSSGTVMRSSGTVPLCPGELCDSGSGSGIAARRLSARQETENPRSLEAKWPARRRCSTSRARWRCSRGSGAASARRARSTLAAAGATIVGGDIDDAAAEATAKEIAGAGGTASSQRTDVTVRGRRRRPRRPRRVRARARRHRRQHRRRSAQQDGGRLHRRGVRAHPRDQPEERVLRVPSRDPAHGPARVGQHRQHLVGCDRHARADARVLRHDEGRGRDAHEDARDRGRPARHPRERDRTGDDPHELLASQLRRRRGQRRAREARAVPQAGERDGAARRVRAKPRTSRTRSSTSFRMPRAS